MNLLRAQKVTKTPPKSQPFFRIFALPRRLYLWTLSWAEHKYAQGALFILALAESSFFPIPPDVLGLALCAGNPRKSFVFASVCTLGSVLGGVLGYVLGAALWPAVDNLFFTFVPGFSPQVFELVKEKYHAHAVWVVLSAAFTPIPYKVITITAGVVGVAFLPFLVVQVAQA